MQKPRRLALTAAVARHRRVYDWCTNYQVRRWSSSVECTTQDLFQNALCKTLKNPFSPSTLTAVIQWTNLSTIVYNPALFVIKVAILLQYLEIFVPNRKTNMRMFIAVWAVIVTMFTFYLIDVAFNIFICRPRDRYWNRFKPGSCYSLELSMVATGLFNVISDFCILLLPLPSIWKLQMKMKRKAWIFAVFATGMM